MTTIANERATVKWVPINQIIPNPLNPRKNDAIKTEEMQDIIRTRGWEEPLTVYQKGQIYVVMAGHRRLYAAKQSDIREVPVYIVDTPQNHQDEIERIASLQRGRVDWTPYEWGKFTYERWIAWGKPSFADFAKKLNTPQTTVKEYVTVLEYYPRPEIENELQNQIYTMSQLSQLVTWINKFKATKPDIINQLTEDMVRKVMLNKMGNGKLTRDALRRTEIFDVISDEDLIEFLTNSTINLQEVLDIYDIVKPKNTLHGHLVSLGMANKNIRMYDLPTKKEELESLEGSLKILKATVTQKLKQITKELERREKSLLKK